MSVEQHVSDFDYCMIPLFSSIPFVSKINPSLPCTHEFNTIRQHPTKSCPNSQICQANRPIYVPELQKRKTSARSAMSNERSGTSKMHSHKQKRRSRRRVLSTVLQKGSSAESLTFVSCLFWPSCVSKVTRTIHHSCSLRTSLTALSPRPLQRNRQRQHWKCSNRGSKQRWVMRTS